MNRERIHLNREEIIEKYLSNELSGEEALEFEEHLLTCAQCRTELTQKSQLLDSMEKYAAKSAFQSRATKDKDRRKPGPLFWYALAAAGVALVIGLFLFPFQNINSPSADKAIVGTESDSLDSAGSTGDQVALHTDTAEVELPGRQRRRIANLETYRENPIFESQVGIHTRAGYLVVDAPADSLECVSGSSHEIQFSGAKVDSLFLAVLNNKGEILFEERIASGFMIQMEYPGGLYYWQLSDEEETLHTGKILIRQ